MRVHTDTQYQLVTKEVMSLQERYVGGFGGKKEKGEML